MVLSEGVHRVPGVMSIQHETVLQREGLVKQVLLADLGQGNADACRWSGLTELSPAGRGGTPDGVGTVGALLPAVIRGPAPDPWRRRRRWRHWEARLRWRPPKLI